MKLKDIEINIINLKNRTDKWTHISNIFKDFNIKRFNAIYINENNFKESIEKIKYLDNNNEEYFKMLNRPWFKDNNIPDHFKSENFYKFMDKILV